MLYQFPITDVYPTGFVLQDVGYRYQDLIGKPMPNRYGYGWSITVQLINNLIRKNLNPYNGTLNLSHIKSSPHGLSGYPEKYIISVTVQDNKITKIKWNKGDNIWKKSSVTS